MPTPRIPRGIRRVASSASVRNSQQENPDAGLERPGEHVTEPAMSTDITGQTSAGYLPHDDSHEITSAGHDRCADVNSGVIQQLGALQISPPTMNNTGEPGGGTANATATPAMTSNGPFPRPRRSDRPATADDVLGWLLENLELQGYTGLSAEWQPEAFSEVFALTADAQGTLSGSIVDGTDLTTALGRSIRGHLRELYLTKVTSQHRALYPQVLEKVEGGLRAHGVSEQTIASLKPGDKLVMYAELGHRISRQASKFCVYLITANNAEGNSRESTKLWFAQNVSFVEFQSALRNLTSYAARKSGHMGGGYTLNDGPWYYQLLGPNKVAVPPLSRSEIVDDITFRDMIEKMRNPDTPHVSVFHVSSLRVVSRSNQNNGTDYGTELDPEDI